MKKIVNFDLMLIISIRHYIIKLYWLIIEINVYDFHYSPFHKKLSKNLIHKNDKKMSKIFIFIKQYSQYTNFVK